MDSARSSAATNARYSARLSCPRSRVAAIICWRAGELVACAVPSAFQRAKRSFAARRESTPPMPPTPPPTPPAPTPVPEFPTSHACRPGGAGAALPYCDASLPTAARVADLVGRMTPLEKCAMTGDGATAGGGGIERLGVEKYSWNTEALHGLAADCLTVDGVTRCPTVFPVGPGMGATFNLSLAGKMGVAISDEARAMNNLGGCRNRGSGGCGWGNGNWYIGLNVWVPNLNINRDPRWGRNIEGSQSPARGLPTVPPSRPPHSATSSAGRACRH